MTPEERAEQQREQTRDLAVSVALVLGWFLVAALVGAWVWERVVDLPEFTRIATTGTMDEEQLAKQFAINGWFLTIGAVGGLVSGLVLLLLRRRSPVVMVFVVALGAALASWVMLRCGLAWGPVDPNTALAGAELGDKIPIRLEPDINAVHFAWPFATLIGAAIALWILDSADQRRNRRAARHQGVLDPR